MRGTICIGFSGHLAPHPWFVLDRGFVGYNTLFVEQFRTGRMTFGYTNTVAGLFAGGSAAFGYNKCVAAHAPSEFQGASAS